MNMWSLSGSACSVNRATQGEPDAEWVVDAQAWPDQHGLLTQPTPAPADGIASVLTRREQQILTCLVRGASAKEVARELCISEGTVRKHRENLRTKLGLRNTAAMVAWAIERGMQPGQSAVAPDKTSLQTLSKTSRRKP
jgi:two-component system nitrate/nitrite response regulator NarL